MAGGARALLRASAAAVMLLAAAPAEAQGARVLGRVTDGVGNAIPAATVTLVPADSGAAPRTATSGATGGFQFDDVPPGDYTVRAERPGYRPREARVRIRPGEVETPVVRLPRGRGGADAEAGAAG